eukprot:4677106-Prymnesium_polylepis.1
MLITARGGFPPAVLVVTAVPAANARHLCGSAAAATRVSAPGVWSSPSIISIRVTACTSAGSGATASAAARSGSGSCPCPCCRFKAAFCRRRVPAPSGSFSQTPPRELASRPAPKSFSTITALPATSRSQAASS